MPRNKYPEITEQRILDTAAKLFYERGWEQTTIQDIVDELGDLTRGAFYHHFKSKEDIIDAVLERTASVNDPFQTVQKMTHLNGLEKLRQAFLLSLQNLAHVKVIKSAPNILTEPRVIAKQLQMVTKSAEAILLLLNEGNADGSIHVQRPEQVAQTFMLLTNVWLSPAIFSVSREEHRKKVLHLQEMYAAIGLAVIDNTVIEALEELYLV